MMLVTNTDIKKNYPLLACLLEFLVNRLVWEAHNKHLNSHVANGHWNQIGDIVPKWSIWWSYCTYVFLLCTKKQGFKHMAVLAYEQLSFTKKMFA